MKKCILIAISLVMMLTSCATTNGVKKEKIDDGLVRYSDVVLDTIRYEHPKLVPDSNSGKFNLHKGADSENINAYIENNTFYIEAAYECKSANLIKINRIIFMGGDEKLEFKKTRVLPSDLDVEDYHYEQLINPYFSYASVDEYSYEEFKMMLTEEEVDQLSSILEAGTCYVAFAGERGRTDLYKLNKKVLLALRTMIEKYDYLLYGEPEPIIEEEEELPELTEDFDYEYDLEAEGISLEEDTTLEEDATTDATLEGDITEEDTLLLEEDATLEDTPTEDVEVTEDAAL